MPRVVCTAAAERQKSKPDLAAEDGLSKVANALINFKPLFAVMKVMARNTMKSTASKNGIDWDGTVREYESKHKAELAELKVEMEDPAISYPSYYTQEFHGYTEGNLNWLVSGCPALTYCELLGATVLTCPGLK